MVRLISVPNVRAIWRGPDREAFEANGPQYLADWHIRFPNAHGFQALRMGDDNLVTIPATFSPCHPNGCTACMEMADWLAAQWNAQEIESD